MLRYILSCCLVSVVCGSGGTAVDADAVPADGAWNGRIIGGSTAQLGQFPYQVSLRTTLTQNHFCGAFIVTDRWMGTAAHCTINRLPQNVIAVVGAVSRSTEGVRVPLMRIVNHPEYNNSNLRNDISLIKTQVKIEFSSIVQPILLNSVAAIKGTSAVASGWGYTSNPGQAASNLQWIKVKIIDVDECRTKMSKANAVKVFDTTICAESQSSGGACMGDSGGPLVANNIIIGIVSWGVPCGMGYPDVYTRINVYHSWIDSIVDFEMK